MAGQSRFHAGRCLLTLRIRLGERRAVWWSGPGSEAIKGPLLWAALDKIPRRKGFSIHSPLLYLGEGFLQQLVNGLRGRSSTAGLGAPFCGQVIGKPAFALTTRYTGCIYTMSCEYYPVVPEPLLSQYPWHHRIWETVDAEHRSSVCTASGFNERFRDLQLFVSVRGFQWL
ncbi:hypothetical protein CEXT_762031 [Caerostris extrusa]|uniref:Uncharacterized protein n=1 Tax=Caerostris extrusa TaxID=172846 RepID=A0AAV4S606_CAEEX|nr:hypothetical protein CEXT_762031 [Caerostris extrusa]